MKRPGVLLITLLLLSAVGPAPPLQGALYWFQGVRGKNISYAEDHRVAEFVGTTVIHTGQTLKLQSAWKAQGANMDSVAHSFVWKLNGATYSTTPDLVVNNLSPGDYSLEFAHFDVLNRHYAYSGRVQVLEPADYTQLVASVVAANQVLFSTGSGGGTVYLPIVLGTK